MLAINFILAILFSVLALIGITLTVIRTIGTNKRWKVVEPELIRDLENSLGQKILCTAVLNASHSTDFSHGNGFWLWMAFTSDRIAFAMRDVLARRGKGEIYLSRRCDASMKYLEKKFAELEFKDTNSSERVGFVVMLRSCDGELLKRFIPIRPDKPMGKKQ